MGTVYRNELSGTLHGLLRVRGFTQDDAHIFCTPEQLPDEVDAALDFALSVLSTFGFEKFDLELSVRDPEDKEKYAGSDEEWVSVLSLALIFLEISSGLVYLLTYTP